jgi:hypothetical protein
MKMTLIMFDFSASSVQYITGTEVIVTTNFQLKQRNSKSNLLNLYQNTQFRAILSGEFRV